MIRQRNIEPVSFVGIEEFDIPSTQITGAVAAAAYLGCAVPNVAKVQLVDLTVNVDVAAAGGGTLSFSIYKSPANVRTNNAGTLVKAAQTGVTAVGLNRFDLSQVPPIDPTNPLLLAGQPNNFLLQVGWVNVGAVTGITFGFKLRFRPYLVGRDV